MRKSLVLAAFVCFSTLSFGQRHSSMHANRYTYFTMGGGYPYFGVQFGYQYDQNTYLQIQALTDGGGIWKENKFNDWRTFSVIRKIPLEPLHSEVRIGMGIVQTAEQLSQQRANTFGAAPQLGYAWHPTKNVGVMVSWTWPYSPATSLTTGVLFGVEYRIGRYAKENGLYSRRSRPEF